MARILETTMDANMNSVWRIYRDEDHWWRWQRVSTDRVVLAQSRTRFSEYDRCLADAESNGYLFQPSQSKRVRGPSLRPRAARDGD